MSKPKKNVTSTRVKILLIGPFPPPYGGTTVSFQHLTHYIINNTDYEVLIKRTNLIKRKNIFSIYSYLVSLMKSDVISLHANPRRAFFQGVLLMFFAKVFRKRFQVRFFGGDLKLLAESNIIYFKLLMNRIFKLITKLEQVKQILEVSIRARAGPFNLNLKLWYLILVALHQHCQLLIPALLQKECGINMERCHVSEMVYS